MFNECVLLLFLLVDSYISVTEGCCLCRFDVPVDNRDLFCSSEWVADITVTEVNLTQNFYEYSINYTTVYKMPLELLEDNKNYPTKIYSNSSGCSRKLLKDKKYLLTGNVLKIKDKKTAFHGIKINGICSIFDTEFQESLRNGTIVDCSEVKDD